MSNQEKTITAEKGHPAWRMLIAACLMVGGGQGLIFNISGIFMASICATNGYTTASFGLVISVGALGLIIALGMTGKILRKFPLRPLLVTLVIITGLCYTALSFCHSLPLFFILFILTYAAGAIPAMVTGPMLIGNWFEAKKGMCMGIVMACGCAFGIIGNIVGGSLIDSGGYSLAYLVLGPCSLLLMLIGALMAVIAPAAMGLAPYGAQAGEAAGKSDAAAADAATADAPGIPAKVALKSFAFIALFLVIFILVWGGSFQTLAASFAVSKGFSTTQGGIFTSIFQVGALVGSFLVGMLDDKIGGRNTTFICFGLIIVGVLAIMFSGSIVPALCVSFLIMGLGCSGSGVQTPILTSKIFGQKDYTAIFSKIQMAQMIGGMIAVPVYGALADSAGGYNSLFIFIAGISALGIVLTITAIGAGKKLWKKTVGTEAPE